MQLKRDGDHRIETVAFPLAALKIKVRLKKNRLVKGQFVKNFVDKLTKSHHTVAHVGNAHSIRTSRYAELVDLLHSLLLAGMQV